MELKCKSCNAQNRMTAIYCKKCGTLIGENKGNTLDQVIGREDIKIELNELVKSINQLKKGWNSSTRFNLNMIILGNTGTGKTSMPNIICKYLFEKHLV